MKTDYYPTKPIITRPPRVFVVAVLAAMAGLSADAATYVGTDACNECHSSKVQQVRGSIHSKMIRVNAHLPGVIHGDLRKPNAPKLPASNDPTNDVHWVMGGWYKEESYIRRERHYGSFSRVIALHEGSNFSRETEKTILVVHLANLLARKMGFSFFEWDSKDPVGLPSASLLGVSPEVIAKVEAKVKEIIKDVAHLF